MSIEINGYIFENDGIKGDKWEDVGPQIFAGLGFSKIQIFKNKGKRRATCGRPDLRVFKNATDGYFSVDTKQGSSVLSYDGTKIHRVQGSSVVLYAPIIPDEACVMSPDGQDFVINPDKVEYFILTKHDFIKAVIESGLYKDHHTATSGDDQIHMETFYSNTQHKLMRAKKYRKLVELLYEADITTEVEEW